MARVTVEDCAQVVNNRFELVALSSQRARTIASGAPITVDRDNDKDSVVALREIADRTVSTDKLRNLLIESCQEKVKLDAYGVEAAEEEKKSNDVSVDDAKFEEVREEMEALHGKGQQQDDSLYGDEELSVED